MSEQPVEIYYLIPNGIGMGKKVWWLAGNIESLLEKKLTSPSFNGKKFFYIHISVIESAVDQHEEVLYLFSKVMHGDATAIIEVRAKLFLIKFR